LEQYRRALKEKICMDMVARPARIRNLRTLLVAATGGIGAYLVVAAVQLVWLYFESWVFRASGLFNYLMFAAPQGLALLGIALAWLGFNRNRFWWIIVGLLIMLFWVAWFFLPFEVGLISLTFFRH
jgi:hypothetical protein